MSVRSTTPKSLQMSIRPTSPARPTTTVPKPKMDLKLYHALGALMLLKIRRDYRKSTCATAAKTSHMQECAAGIRTAVASSYFIVFKQISGRWAFIRLVEQEMKSYGRSDTIADVEATEPERKRPALDTQ